MAKRADLKPSTQPPMFSIPKVRPPFSSRKLKPPQIFELFGARLTRHARYIELHDRQSSWPDSPETWQGRPWGALSRGEQQQAMAAHRAAMRAVERELDEILARDEYAFAEFDMGALEIEYRRTRNGALAWEALAISQGCGWPIPPRWVLQYLGQAAHAILDGQPPERVLNLKNAGGPRGVRRLRTFARRRHAVMRVAAWDRALWYAEFSVVRKRVPNTWALVRKGVPEVWASISHDERAKYNTMFETARETRRKLVAELGCSATLPRAEIAAAIVAREESLSPRTLLNWYVEGTLEGLDGPTSPRRVPLDAAPETP